MTLGVLALLGSGEIAPSMTKVHRQLLKRLDTVHAVSLDTAYGFQANVPQMTEKIVDYFATSLRVPITPLHFTVFEGTTDVALDVAPCTAAPTAATAGGNVTVLASRLTSPPSERARPSNLVPAPNVMSLFARIVPASEVDGASAALPPTNHRT